MYLMNDEVMVKRHSPNFTRNDRNSKIHGANSIYFLPSTREVAHSTVIPKWPLFFFLPFRGASCLEMEIVDR